MALYGRILYCLFRERLRRSLILFHLHLFMVYFVSRPQLLQCRKVGSRIGPGANYLFCIIWEDPKIHLAQYIFRVDVPMLLSTFLISSWEWRQWGSQLGEKEKLNERMKYRMLDVGLVPPGSFLCTGGSIGYGASQTDCCAALPTIESWARYLTHSLVLYSPC